MTTETKQPDRLARALDALQITIEARFIPWSESRNKSEKDPSLNWAVDVYVAGRKILSDVDYMQGSAHCPAYKLPYRNSVDGSALIRKECETGKEWTPGGITFRVPIAPPSTHEVLYSLLQDSDALNAPFEEWATDLGYDADSRTAEKIYQQCLQTGLRLRSGIGEPAFSQLLAETEDY
jgi:hypothetical protein